MIETAREQSGDRRLDADVVIVGSGAGGAMAASELTRRGLEVVVLEEGPSLAPRDMTQREDEMFPKLFQERGGRSTSDRAIRVLGGRCIGGSTVHNINLCKRTPPEILDLWARNHAVSGCTGREMTPVFESVERDLSVTEIAADRRNRNNRILERGVAALGWKGGPLRHNRVGCRGSGFCEIGCPFGAKQNAAKILIPDAVSRGATVIADAKAERVLWRSNRVRGVLATALGAKGEPRGAISVRARAVVLAGSAIGSAVLALRSGLPDPHDQLGRRLRMHPGVAVVGLFGDRVEGWKGIPQSYECTEWLDLSEGSDRRVWITTAFAHPVGAATMLPGFGRIHDEWMRKYPYVAVLTAMIHDDTAGRVRARRDGRARIDYRLIDEDVRQLALGLRACARLLLAGGAREVLVPSVSPVTVRKDGEVESIPDSAAHPHEIAIAAVHPMGTLRLGDDARRAVVTSTGEHHQVRGLFVLDGSLFPTSLGGPPQISVYSFSRHLAPHVANRAR